MLHASGAAQNFEDVFIPTHTLRKPKSIDRLLNKVQPITFIFIWSHGTSDEQAKIFVGPEL